MVYWGIKYWLLLSLYFFFEFFFCSFNFTLVSACSYVQACTPEYGGAYGDKRLTLSAAQVQFTRFGSRQASDPQESACLNLLCIRTKNTYHHAQIFECEFGELNSGPHVCILY